MAKEIAVYCQQNHSKARLPQKELMITVLGLAVVEY